MAIVVAVAVLMVVAVLMWVAIVGTALTGRERRHSTAGLSVVAAAILPVAQLDEVVREHHAKLRAYRSVEGRPV
jgi:hypothetical protein